MYRVPGITAKQYEKFIKLRRGDGYMTKSLEAWTLLEFTSIIYQYSKEHCNVYSR